jgi:hypothetical protein
MVMDTAARYVLDREGDNVLPVPVERTALRSAITAPPVQPDVTRETPLAEGGTPGPAGTTPGTTPGATGTTPGTGATGTIINPGAQAGQQQQQQSSVVPNQGGQVAVPGGVKPAGGTGAATAKPVSDIGADESGKAASSDGATGQKPVAPLTDGEASGPQMVGPMPPGAGTATDEDKAKEEEAKKQDAGGGLSGKSN